MKELNVSLPVASPGGGDLNPLFHLFVMRRFSRVVALFY
jgi:hypothetical protein